MPWVQQIGNAFSAVGCRFSMAAFETDNPDVVVYGWANQETIKAINEAARPATRVTFLRRYEFYQGYWRTLDPKKVDCVFFVNEIFRKAVEQSLPELKTALFYNGVDLSKWTYKERAHGKNIAMVGNLNERKNIPLALQILHKLDDYKLHLFGEIQDPSIFNYIENFVSRTGVSVTWNDRVSSKLLDAALDSMNYLLCTASSEGNPNNVLEAMAKGIKPVIHAWPGAVEQFSEAWVFDSIETAVYMMKEPSIYESKKIRIAIEERFNGNKIYKAFVAEVKKLHEQKEITCPVS